MSMVALISSSLAAAKSALGDIVQSFAVYSVVSTYVDGENTHVESSSNIDGVFIDVDDTYFEDTIAHEATYMLIMFSDAIDKNMEVEIDGSRHQIIEMNKVRTAGTTHITIIAVK